VTASGIERSGDGSIASRCAARESAPRPTTYVVRPPWGLRKLRAAVRFLKSSDAGAAQKGPRGGETPAYFAHPGAAPIRYFDPCHALAAPGPRSRLENLVPAIRQKPGSHCEPTP